jgi:hypothetical protein
LEFLAEHGGPFAARDPQRIKTALNSLRFEMEKPGPQALKTVPLADDLIGRLDEWLSDLSTNPRHADERAIHALMAGLRDDAKDAAGEGVLDRWESGMQHYLGLAACCNALSDHGSIGDERPSRMQEIRAALSFPHGEDGPRDYRPDDVRKKILAIEP